MIEFKFEYRAVAFVEGSDFDLKPDIIRTMMDAFQDKGFIPGNFQEFVPPGPVHARLRMSSLDQEWNIDFHSNSIQIVKKPVDLRGTNLGTVADFCKEAVNWYERILTKSKKKANRLALITSFLLKEMTVADLDKIYLKLFKTNEFYARNKPFEWTWRCAARKAMEMPGSQEELNMVSLIDRVKGQMGSSDGVVPIDRIRVSMDLNTIPENGEHRFGIDHLATFFGNVPELHDTLLQEITEFING